MGKRSYIGGSTVFRVWDYPKSDPKEQVKKYMKLFCKTLSTFKSEKRIINKWI